MAKYFRFGILNLFLRSETKTKIYIVNGVHFGSYIMVYATNGTCRSTCFPSCDKEQYTFYFSLATIDTWFLDLDLDILLTES